MDNVSLLGLHSLLRFAWTDCTFAGEDTCEHVSERNKSGLLQRATRRNVRGVATRTGNAAKVVSGALQFLHEVRAESTPPKCLGNFHVDITVRPIVVK